LNCSQKELSEKLGLMLRTIQRIENNELKPSFYSLKLKSLDKKPLENNIFYCFSYLAYHKLH